MKKSSFICLAMFLTTIKVYALEIDEKLTLRLLKVSDTKKTVLINRGAEDGLVVGDHAKFYVTAGVVARGVSEKVSPTRSVWALYRIIDPAEINQDKVLNLKIATPVKITDDPTKSMKEEAIPGGSEVMNVEGDPGKTSDTGSNKEIIVTDSDREELKDLGIEEAPAKPVTGKSKKSPKNTSVVDDDDVVVESSSSTRNWEAFGTLNFNSLSGTEENGTEESTSAEASTVDFSLGIEKYFLDSTGFLRDLSLVGFIHKRSMENGSSIKVTSTWFEYGIGANYHFYNSAREFNRLVGYGTFNLGKGSVTAESQEAAVTTTQEGDNTFISVGLGAKYILSSGFGVRALFDYYRSSETFTTDDVTIERSIAGPRLQFGLSYRF